jgi:hypothetical protein
VKTSEVGEKSVVVPLMVATEIVCYPAAGAIRGGQVVLDCENSTAPRVWEANVKR